MAKKIKPLTLPELQRFWSKVSPCAIDTCWVWVGQRFKNQYGKFMRKKSPYYAHRVAWMVSRGFDPAELQVLHRCDYPPCVNPHHLFLGTQQDNIDDCIRKGRKVDPPRNDVRGSKNGCSKLTERDIKDIRRRRKNGEALKSIAVDYSISVGTTCQIAKRSRWKHI